ncbi:hypothetical protein JCM12296A_56030 [Desulfosarcina cetonica]|uniref:hypothetical protein n=1 Tax=Desulfosarcina cetonica TaxID=90730 RepID=UPI001C4493FE|nr:hypothetical protein [Desulfosarcina cetonica]
MGYEIIEYTSHAGQNLFREWFFGLDARAAAKVTTAIVRFGPGYRVYFAYDGKNIILLLAGGSKQRQSKDIETSQGHVG